jgi:hypothetical protein
LRLLSENAGHVPVTGLRLGSHNMGKGAMTPKNIALEPDLLEQVGKLAQEEGQTPDELANELLGSLIEIRKQAEASDRRWQKLVEYGSGQAHKLGIGEEDVDRLIHEWRAEQRGRYPSNNAAIRAAGSCSAHTTGIIPPNATGRRLFRRD